MTVNCAGETVWREGRSKRVELECYGFKSSIMFTWVD